MSKNFYEKYAYVDKQVIHSIDALERVPGQPGFIHMALVNNQVVAFLGEPVEDYSQYLNRFIRTDNMLIPEFARMVNIETLKKQLKKSKKGDKTAIFTAEKEFFYEGQLDSNVLINICGMISNKHYPNMNIHPCENRLPEFLHSDFMGLAGTCPWGVLTSKVDSSLSSSAQVSDMSDRLQHGLMLFYISTEDIEESNKREQETNFKRDPNVPSPLDVIIQGKLSNYFGDTFWKESKSVKFKWSEIQGIFLIPMLLPNQEIGYYCLLNKDGKSNKGESIRKLLSTWLDAVKKLNDDVDNQEIIIGANDLSFAFLDRWCISLGRDANVNAYELKKVYKQEALAGSIRIKKNK